MSHPQTVLPVANRTADTDRPRQAVRERAAKGVSHVEAETVPDDDPVLAAR